MLRKNLNIRLNKSIFLLKITYVCRMMHFFWHILLKTFPKKGKIRLKCIMRTFIHPSKVDSPYSPFHSPFLKGESPFSKGEWASGKKIHPSFTLFQLRLLGDSPFRRVIYPFWGWFTLLEGWFTLKGECVHPFWRVNLLSRSSFTLQKGWMEGWIWWITLRRVNEGSHNTL